MGHIGRDGLKRSEPGAIPPQGDRVVSSRQGGSLIAADLNPSRASFPGNVHQDVACAAPARCRFLKHTPCKKIVDVAQCRIR